MALINKTSRIDKLKAELDALQPMRQELQQKLDEKLRLEFHYNTNHIEGNTLTYGETKLAILFDQVSDGHTLREFEEMKASDVAYKMVQVLAKDERPLTEMFIKQLNERLLVRPYYKEAITTDGQETSRLISIGEYKTQPNSVRLQNGEIFHYASPTETPAMMTDMIDWYRAEEEQPAHHPVVVAAWLHYKFVRIHPFDDGNGRVSRLLMNYVLFKHGYPPVIIKSEDKPNYLRALNRADVGEEEAFFEYVADQLIWSLELSIKAAKGEDIEEQQDWKKKLALLDRELSVNDEIQIVKTEPVVQKITKDVILPAVEKVLNETSLFDNMFMDKYYLLKPYSNPGSTIPVSSPSDLIKGYSTDINRFKDDILITCTYFQFKKNGVNTFNIKAGILIEFDTYTYNILVSIPQNTDNYEQIFTKYYHEELTETDIDTLTSSYANCFLTLIESNVSKST